MKPRDFLNFFKTRSGKLVLFAVIFGLLIDRMNRIWAGILAMAIAGTGYIAGGFVGEAGDCGGLAGLVGEGDVGAEGGELGGEVGAVESQLFAGSG